MKNLFITILIIIIGIGILVALATKPQVEVSNSVNQPVTEVPTNTPEPSKPSTDTPQTETVKVTALSIVEDSRCPANVNCIQAGTVRVKVRVDAKTSEEVILKLNEPKTVAGHVVTLVSVSPETFAGKTIEFKDYNFKFDIK
jgi:hypothetical protein